MRRRVSLFFAIACWPWNAQALDLAFPRGSVEVFSERSALDSYDLPIAPFEDGTVAVETFEGEILRQAFRIDNDSITLLQIIAPLRAALEQAGYTVRLDCTQASCGGFDFRFGIEVLPAPAMFVDLTAYRVLSAQKQEAAISFLVSATDERRFLQMIQVRDAAPVTQAEARDPLKPIHQLNETASGLITDSLADLLDQRGHAVLEDLAFQTGDTALSAGPYASLDALADYLQSKPETRIALVGHTDAVGGLEGNISISRARALAVRTRLVDTYNVSPDQISAQGIGFLSPRASNSTENGRALNRRVEAVVTSQQ